MSSLFGIIGLVIFTYVRPHEFYEPLKDYPFLYLFLFLSLAGLAHDVSRKRVRLMTTPHLPYAITFTVWCALTLAIKNPGQLGAKIMNVVVCLILYVIISSSLQRISSLLRLLTVVFASGLFVAYVGAAQGLSPFQCCVYNPADKNSVTYPDGRECMMVDPEGAPHDGNFDCMQSGQPGLAYTCEKAGPFGTTSCGGGRVRYLGVLLDPNEMALATALTVPFAFMFLEIKRSVFRLALLLGTLMLVAVEIVYTQSRGGQLTFGAVLGAYFIKKYGWKRGILVGAAMAIPMIALGGRSDDSANESTLERLGCAAAGIRMLMSFPLTGVGYGEFTEHHNLTAHNAYILAAGELGAPGMWLFAFLIFLAIKIPITVLQFEVVDTPETVTIKALAMALLAALIGCSLGIFFLSWCYHYVLWIHWGMCGALYSCVKRLYPEYECKLTWKDVRYICPGYIVFLFLWSRYIMSKNAW